MSVKKPRSRNNSKSKKVVKPPKVLDPNSRLRKKPNYKSFRLHAPIKYPGHKLPSAYDMSKKAIRLLMANAGPIAWYLMTFGLLILVFVSGIVSAIDIESIQLQIEEAQGDISGFSSNVIVLGVMLNSAFSASGTTSSLYQALLVTIGVLTFIWLFRQQQAGSRASLKDALYGGMYPLVPFLAIAGVIAVQALPAIAGGAVYGAVISGGLAITALEQIVWLIFMLFAVVASLYFISSSLIALFIVTLPEMTPMVALKEAKKLVLHRRSAVLGRLVFLGLLILAVYVAVVFPAIFASTLVARVLHFTLTVLALPFVVAYIFVLYRELL